MSTTPAIAPPDRPAPRRDVRPSARRARAAGAPPLLAGMILDIFHQACDEGDHGVAAELLRAAEAALVRPGGDAASPGRRRAIEALVAAHERLWLLRRHPQH